MPKPSCAQKIVEDSDDAAGTEMEGGDSESASEDDHVGDIVDLEVVEPTEKADAQAGGEDTEVDYMTTKALGDADHEVSYVFFFARHNTKNFCI